jgi:hypothetical protein
MSADHAETFALLTAIRGDVDDAGPLASQVGAEDVDREAGIGRDGRMRGMSSGGMRG